VSNPDEHSLDAPITSVTVYPDRARVTRVGRLPLGAGEQRVLVEALPLGVQEDSVRVTGRGPATVLGVDVERRQQPRITHADAAELDGRRRALAAQLAEVTDADAVAQQRADFLGNLAQRAGATYAHALATGAMNPQAVATLGDTLTEQLGAVRAERRELAGRRERIQEEQAAVERRIAQRGTQFTPDRTVAAVTLNVAAGADATAEVELELSYVIDGARWESSYDIRLDADRLTLTWFGMVTQQTGENWPECELLLSTARPSGAVEIPELDPWYLDRFVEPPRLYAAAPGAAPMMARAASYGEAQVTDASAPQMEKFADHAVAAFEQGVAAATYRPERPVAVLADGAPHRTTVAVLEMPVRLDYVTAPVRSAEAHLRATATNGTEHTVLAGKASVFHGGEFVGTTRLATWAPGEEVELALGVDDRIRIERELVRRSASKTTLRDNRRREAEYKITVANHTPRAARVTVLDQVPVSRDEGISVRELRAEPPPAERTDMGVLTWSLQLAPGGTGEVRLGLRVELAKGVDMTGWRE
jgi:uncharacterized protein (TIGR02231 family)